MEKFQYYISCRTSIINKKIVSIIATIILQLQYLYLQYLPKQVKNF